MLEASPWWQHARAASIRLSQSLVPKVTVASALHDGLRARELYVGTKALPANECPPISPALFHPRPPSARQCLRHSRTPDFSSSVMLSPHVSSDAKDREFALGCGRPSVSALRPKVACTGAGTPLHCGISVPSMSESGQTRSFGDDGSMSGLPESGHGWAIRGAVEQVRAGDQPRDRANARPRHTAHAPRPRRRGDRMKRR